MPMTQWWLKQMKKCINKFKKLQSKDMLLTCI